MEGRFSKSYSERLDVLEEEMDKLIKGSKNTTSELKLVGEKFDEIEENIKISIDVIKALDTRVLKSNSKLTDQINTVNDRNR